MAIRCAHNPPFVQSSKEGSGWATLDRFSILLVLEDQVQSSLPVLRVIAKGTDEWQEWCPPELTLGTCNVDGVFASPLEGCWRVWDPTLLMPAGCL